jgi:hypothetical protein
MLETEFHTRTKQRAFMKFGGMSERKENREGIGCKWESHVLQPRPKQFNKSVTVTTATSLPAAAPPARRNALTSPTSRQNNATTRKSTDLCTEHITVLHFDGKLWPVGPYARPGVGDRGVFRAEDSRQYAEKAVADGRHGVVLQLAGCCVCVCVGGGGIQPLGI